MGAIGSFDHDAGTLTTWSPGESCGVQEPNLVVRPGAAEADGYVLALVNRFAANRSDLAILDARRIAAGPVALLRLPLRVRSTFHGMWVPEAAFTSGRYTA